MQNELLLLGSVVFVFGCTLLGYRFFGKSALYCMTVVATVFANVEALILIRAFGMEQTLGNVLFAVTFLITDILSENEGKRAANKAVNLGICATVFFLLLSQSWLLYQPSTEDWVMPGIRTVFTNTPRTVGASLVVYAVSQKFDVWLYHKWWALTERRSGDRRRFLWLRNNGSTLISQIINTALFTTLAFGGLYPLPVMLDICKSTYLIYVVTSLLDTPAVYLARRIKEAKKVPA